MNKQTKYNEGMRPIAGNEVRDKTAQIVKTRAIKIIQQLDCKNNMQRKCEGIVNKLKAIK